MAQSGVVLRATYGCPRNIGFRDMRTGTIHGGSMVACRDGSDMIEEPSARTDLRVLGVMPMMFSYTTTTDRERRLQVDTGQFGMLANSAGADEITESDIDKICWAVDGNTVARLGVTEADLVTFVNEIRTDLIAHLADATVHNVADTLNTIAHAAATNTATAITLLTELRDNYEAHRVQLDIGGTDVHDTPDVVNFVTKPTPTTAAQALALALDLKAKYNAHGATGAPVHNSADATNIVTGTATGRSPAGYIRYVMDGGIVVDFTEYENIAAMRLGGIL